MKPFQMNKRKSWPSLFLERFTIMATLAAGLFALYQYSANSNADRAKETLNFVERFDRDKILDARQKIDFTFYKINEEILKKVEDKQAYSKYINKVIKNKSLSSNLNYIFDFYDQLQACSLSNLCDADIAVRFFGKYAFDIVGTVYPYIETQRDKTGDKQFGIGIQYFSDEYAEYKKINKTTLLGCVLNHI